MMSTSFARTQIWRPCLAALALSMLVVACAKEEATSDDLVALAEANTESRLSESAQASVADLRVASVDTITSFDPETGEETVEVITNYEDAEGGDTKSRMQGLLDDRGGSERAEVEMVRSLPVYKVVDEMPHYPAPNCTGTSEEDQACQSAALIEHVYSSIEFPAIARESGVEGMAVVSFVVGTDGELLEPQVVRLPDSEDPAVGEAIAGELMDVVNTMPAWIPGKQAGEPVQVRFNLPIKFKLEAE